MTKVVVIYDSKYGNTKLVAETIAGTLNEDSEIEAEVVPVKETTSDLIAASNAMLIGSPNHMGNSTRRIKKFIDSLEGMQLEGRIAAVFDTYIGKDFEKAVHKMEERISQIAPGIKLAVPGLSIKVGGMKGPVIEEELAKCRDFASNFAAQL